MRRRALQLVKYKTKTKKKLADLINIYLRIFKISYPETFLGVQQKMWCPSKGNTFTKLNEIFFSETPKNLRKRLEKKRSLKSFFFLMEKPEKKNHET